MEDFKRAWAARKDPLVTNREYDVAALLTWFFYAGWGLLTMFSGDRSVFSNLPRWEDAYPQLWGGAVGMSALSATSAAVIIFFLNPGHIASRVRAKRAEIVSLCILLGLMAVYPVTLLVSGDAQGNFRPEILSLSLSYFPFAVFRVRHLLERIRQLYRYIPKGAE